MSILLFKLCFWLLFASAYAESVAELKLSGAKPGCPTKCGNLTVPYPFGVGIECALTERLYITCNETYESPKPFIRDGNLEILGISAIEVRIGGSVAYKCYNESGLVTDEADTWTRLTRHPSYTFSAEKNMFVSVGCNTIALIKGRENGDYTTGCVTMCAAKERVSNGSCSGIGCCHTSIPKGLKYFQTFIDRPSNLGSEPFTFSPCSYAFLAEYKEFQFLSSDIGDSNYYDRMWGIVPVVLDWVVEHITCKDAWRNRASFACKENTDCVDSNNGPGYRCSCKKGYEGNPYLTPGCQDINECEDSSKNQCIPGSKCINLPGAYNCTCPRGIDGDGKRDSTGCTPKSKKRKDFPFTQVILGLVLFVLISSCWVYFDQKRKRVFRLKEKNFKQNGGLLLQQHQMSSHEGGAVKLTRIYTSEELKKATKDYDESRIIGRGANGTVYKGIFPREQTETVVAIKKSKTVDETQIEQFINELVILTQINHRHVVRLLGCCLETEVPLLVYEFISNGTLHEHIHKRPLAAVPSRISLSNRLRIATETASALAYLHSAASIPVIHRDVKSTNILLDDNYATKVADFGASRLIPLDQTEISTLVQGTLGYLDPEYFQTSQLTEKSDVYSFGVVLVELLTGEKAFSNNRSEERRMLASHFILSMRDNALLQVIEKQLVGNDNEKQLFAVAELALRCLNFKGEDRPTMKELAGELERLRRLSEQHPWDEYSGEEPTCLLSKSSDLYPVSLDPSTSDSTGQYSMNTMMSPLNLPR